MEEIQNIEKLKISIKEGKNMHECLLCKRDMKVSNDVFGNGCVRNIYSFLDLKMPRKVNL